jgi:HK97 family phage major capsid protein
MSKRIKELSEKRGAKLKDASALITKATEEKRELSADEAKKIEALQNEAETINQSIITEARQLQLEGSQAPRLSGQEQRDVGRFNIQKLMNHMVRSAKGVNTGALDGVEAELIQEGEREARAAGLEGTGLFLPRMLVRSEKRDMTASGTTSVTGDQGGMTIQTEVRGLLDDFYNASVMRQAGATVLEGLVGNLDLTRIVAGTAAAKKAENASADEVSPTIAKLSLTPKRLPAYVDISERLLAQTPIAIEAAIRASLTAQMLATQEAAFFHGGGTSEANGIAGTSGIGSVAGGDNGLAPAWSHIVGLETAVETSNALLGGLHYISNAKVRGKLKTTAKVSSTDSRMILDNDGLLNGYTPLFTNAVSSTLTKGTTSGAASAIFFGNFSDYWIGYWGGISLEMVRDKTNAISGLYTLVASAYYDGGVYRPKSFSAMLDALTA